MKKYIQHFIVIFTLFFAAASCKKDDAVQKNIPESVLVQGVIAGVNGPTSGMVNQKLTFSIIWQNPDGKTKFDHLQDSTINNTKMIRVYTLTNVADSVVISKEPSTVSYVFKASAPGDYYLKFYKTDNTDKTAIIDTIHITK